MNNNNSNTLNQPTIENVRAAYRNAENNPEIKSLLRDLFGDASATLAVDNRPVTERIKTFDDAASALGDEHPFVLAYNTMCDIDEYADTDIQAYMKLRIITCALNEGWKPEFVEDEYRWAPWFVLYTNEEIDRMDDYDRAKLCRVVGRSSYSNASAYGGLGFANVSNALSNAFADNAARLAFKTEALAEYAGEQFIEIYRDFIIPR